MDTHTLQKPKLDRYTHTLQMPKLDRYTHILQMPKLDRYTHTLQKPNLDIHTLQKPKLDRNVGTQLCWIFLFFETQSHGPQTSLKHTPVAQDDPECLIPLPPHLEC